MSRSTAEGVFTRYPESLELDSHKESGPSPTPDLPRAVKIAKAQDDIQNIFFVNFPAELQGASLDEQKAIMDMVQSWQGWATTHVGGKVQQMADAGQVARIANVQGSYRAQIFDYLMRKATWFVKTFEQNVQKHIEVKKIEFHTAILTKALEGFGVPASVFSTLEPVLQSISEGIKTSSTREGKLGQYWIMLTKYNWDPATETTRTGKPIRIIQFRVTEEALEFAINKFKYDSVSFDLQFNQYQAEFNSEVYKKIRPSIDQKHIDMGLDVIKAGILNCPIPP
ncbi:hypothetical protein PG999_007618 [Apiospora kogelbergensis]|uniref:Uncharacterized protein n=1 Tax=Apiospora kogelbergensis TaxID=1337665 RepID=A0AAW0QU54_9PEZI